MKRGWINLAAGVTGMLLLNTGESKAGEFGGFQVDVGIGENTGLPEAWEEEPDFSQNVTEDSEIQEEVWQDNGDDSEEEFLFSDGSGENEGYLPQENQHESVEEPVEQEQGDIAENTGEGSGQIGMEEADAGLRSEIFPAVTPLPTVTPAPVLDSEGENQQMSGYKEKGSTETIAENRTGESEGIFIEENRPELLYWKKEFSSGQPVSLEITAKGEVKILSFRINGKENGWKWKGDSLMALENETDAVTEKAVAELILLYYDTFGHGIFIDGNRKQ